MNEETKEILKDMDLVVNYNKVPIYYTQKHIKTLLDYITNLQQENEFLKLNNPEMNIEHFRIVKENKRKIDNLRKENAEHNDKVVDKARWNEMIYKSRCEKAIEYIEERVKYKVEPFYLSIAQTNILYKILQGSDEK